ncbi:hypothetical protein WICPIJ_003319 [Wickerhamomyces pijperi]|uniref:VHS domain-containing protein n=1 Tax=Wickerhamomyces pijperi TaxID=599730 RepID=A0A9P8QA70_WICPI|nr:hypothetical protein WICPIJ_003319 [Wickerhamomyces pijperi]
MGSDSYSRYKPDTSSSLTRKICKACRASLGEPDLALNLAVADYVNEKQGGAPREAAIVIVNLINSLDSHVSIFALNLLDVLVKNCGYPFHLQISRKEFLNELVKRFPERPPTRCSRTQRMILAAIEEWNQTICKTSKYKDDLGFIRDMHRLLTYKGYTFPEIKEEDLSVLNPSDNLKSLSEIQKEENLAQAAKLQELVRRGRPNDLKEANKLMKIMAGFKDDNIVESKAKVAEDLDKLKRKAEIFTEMLNTAQTNGTFNSQDETLVELYSALKVSQPKIQKLITEEADDEDAVQELLRINDVVNSLVEKYNYLKSGDMDNAAKVNVAAMDSGKASQSLNLIDFDDDSATPPPQTGNGVEDLLSGLGDLNFGNNNNNTSSGPLGEISLFSPQPTGLQSQPQPSSTTQASNFDIFAQLSNNPTPVPSQPQTRQTSNFDLLGDFTSTPSPQTIVEPTTQRHTINNSANVQTTVEINSYSDNQVQATVYFTNNTAAPITNLQFLIAVPKSLSLTLAQQSSSDIQAYSKNGITQSFKIDRTSGAGEFKIKWKISYVSRGSNVDETGVYVLPTN